MSTKIQHDSFKYSIRQYLIESLENFASKKYDFAILHAVIALELLLKEKLRIINPHLIYENIDTFGSQKKRTISLSRLPDRLRNLGVDIDEEKIELISDVRLYRDDLVHYMPKYNREKATSKLVNLYDFILYFSRIHLKLDIRKLVPKHLYKIFNDLLSEWEKIIKLAKKEASKQKKVEMIEPCPICYIKGTVSKKIKKAYCHLCKTDLYIFDCQSCKKPCLEEVNWDLDYAHPEILCHSCDVQLIKAIEDFKSNKEFFLL